MKRGIVPAVAAAILLAAPATAARPPDADGATFKQFGRVAFDRYSLMIDGKRTIIWSGEFHPFRLPSPDLWRDILQKMKASGFNTVSIYFDWGYHSPAPGVYDFTGIRDMDRVLSMAAQEGLYVIARPGPYVNGELTRGGFPGWLVNQKAPARSTAPEYLQAADEWLSRIDAIIARHQIGEPGGSVILYQIENELPATDAKHVAYMDHLAAHARADGIRVPLFHNDQGRHGFWVPRGKGVEGTVGANLDLYAFDAYPGGSCTATGQVTRGSPAPDFGRYGPGGAEGGASASPETPGFLAEYGGGWFDYWGSNGTYACNALEKGSEFERVFYGTNLANGITLQNVYIAYGGTSWGWLPAPVVYTSYDYGAAIDEARNLRAKAQTLKQLGGLIAAVPDLAKMEPATGVTASSPAIRIYHNRNPQTDARFLLVTHKPSNATSDDSFTVDAALPDGHYSLPLRLNGFDAKWLLAGVNLERQRLVYSTSELQATFGQSQRDILLFHGRPGERAETVLRYTSKPTTRVLQGAAQVHFDAGRGDLHISYTHQGLTSVAISGGGRPPLLLLIADEPVAARFWRQDAALVRGGAMLRSAEIAGSTLRLTGDTGVAEPIAIWPKSPVTTVSWNGRDIAVAAQPDGSLVSRAPLDGPHAFALPDLTVASWRVSEASPEARPNYDDSGWANAATLGNVSSIHQPDGQPNLAADPHGFHDGDVWYRGRFSGGTDARQITIHYGAGGAGMMQLWLDGAPVGQSVLPGGLADPFTTGIARFALPATARTPGTHVLALMVRDNGHNEDLGATGTHKEPRGLISASIDAGGRSFVVPVSWRIQGRSGGETLADPMRGVANIGGLHGERFGWHLPAFDDGAWPVTRVPGTPPAFGTRWFRTKFRLDVPEGDDATIGLAFGGINVPRTPGSYRALIFVNGWNMGQFIADIGPQRAFPIPEGVLNHRGENSLALAVTSDGQAALEPVRLVVLHHVRGGLPVRQVQAPGKLQ